MSKSWQPYARYILDAIAKIRRITARGDLSQDDVLYDAVLRNLQTLAEATQHLPEASKERFGDIPWRQINGFRNILVHSYLGELDVHTVQRIVQQTLPPLERAIVEMLEAAGQK